MGCIYSICVGTDPRQYVGSAANLEKRMRYHRWNLLRGSHHCLKLRRAVRRHGIDALNVTVLETVPHADLIPAEQRWLDKLWGSLFNTCPTAQSRLGAKMPLAARRAISASLVGNSYRKGIPFSAADRAKISAGVKRSYANGRKPSCNPQNLSSYNAALKSGAVTHPRKNPKRDAAIVASHAQTRSLKATGAIFGITPCAVWCVIKRCNPSQTRKWSRK